MKRGERRLEGEEISIWEGGVPWAVSSFLGLLKKRGQGGKKKGRETTLISIPLVHASVGGKGGDGQLMVTSKIT